MSGTIKYEDADWRADFDSVRVDQMLRFRALSLREKIQAMEDMAELVAHFRRQGGPTPAAPAAALTPGPSRRERGEGEDRR
jgi:hypothetical protein